ncbi:hypothetical protein N780_02850 [Pontibacillus chungwhensis BH030062]|uniref:Pilus assembly protein PilO n=1 Tax=Pontibacillus chungwhensis BH030062 TaxID=1385513 RepID=A0A0A2URR3_9BACI|nr:hypothetical protein [Pontibacillus chungwhensis]KGP90967.1 hypothetical protein N780_02850 [Pontibacillus chungwhensis BH030062]
MKIEWRRIHTIVVVLLVIVFLAFYWIVHSLYVDPALQEVDRVKSSLNNEERILNSLADQKTEQQDLTLKTSRELQLKLPVLPVQDQVILAMERAENVSGTFIESVILNGDEMIEAEDDEDIDAAEPTSETEEVDEETEEASAVEAPPVMPSVNALTYQVNVLAKSFKDLTLFLEELEQIPRLVSFDEIEFQPNESTTDEEEQVSFLVTFSAFYEPDLSGLQDELPQYHYPEPSQKETPFEGDGEDLSEDEQ